MTALYQSYGRQMITEPLSRSRPVTEAAERRSTGRTDGSAPLPSGSTHRNWEMFVIWGFVVVSFAAFFFCFWAIRAKCRGNWPF